MCYLVKKSERPTGSTTTNTGESQPEISNNYINRESIRWYFVGDVIEVRAPGSLFRKVPDMHIRVPTKKEIEIPITFFMVDRNCKEAIMLNIQLLNSYVGKNIGEICLNGVDDSDKNHCAHFVSHVLNLHFGCTCEQQVSRRSRQAVGANLRVHEVFDQCSEVYEFTSCPLFISGLIFVSKETNFVENPVRIRNVPKKHIGIILNGLIWHYSNTRDQVEVQTMAGFMYHYRGQRNALWYGSLPRVARPIYFGQC